MRSRVYLVAAHEGPVVGYPPGDEGFDRFCVDAYGPLVASLGHQFGDAVLARELAQEALIRASLHWPRVSTLQSPIGWAFRAGVNVGKSWFRRRAAERRAYARLGQEQEQQADPDRAVQLAVRAALAVLPDAEREALILRYFLDLPATEVAQLLGKSPGAVRAATHRGLHRLRSELGESVTVEEGTADVG